MCSLIHRISIFLLLWVQTTKCMSLINQQHSYFMDNGSGPENDEVADFIVSKGYLPNEKNLPKTSILKSVDNDVTYLLSKLSDDELIKLLNDQPKKNIYDIDDIVKVAVDTKSSGQDNSKTDLNFEQSSKPRESFFSNPAYKNKRFRTVTGKSKSDVVFRLDDNQPIESLVGKNNGDANYAALQKLNNLLISRPQEENEKSEEDDEKRELLFDVLVAQLKTLCCKRNKQKKKSQKLGLSDIISQDFYSKPLGTDIKKSSQKGLEGTTEYMFLIINDEIAGTGSEDLISVDPESLEKNSSVLLLGPITTPLSNGQLKSVMSRISNELSKSEYLPLLQQISDGTLTGSNMRLMKSLVTGPETRRYIKPHRCNQQSKLAKIYGGPKWLICTGYLNLNIPSLYDK